jgi:hypothetical protein
VGEERRRIHKPLSIFLFFSLFKVLTFDKQKDISENEKGGDYGYIFFNENLNEMVRIIKKIVEI